MHIAEEIARCHHEKWDGSGYPQGLRGLDIPLAARITALADVFDALTHARCYKPAWTIDASLEEIARGRGTHFDPDLTDVFVPLVEKLRVEHRDLDSFLARDAKSSSFIAARKEIATTAPVIPSPILSIQSSVDSLYSGWPARRTSGISSLTVLLEALGLRLCVVVYVSSDLLLRLDDVI
jgi:hypothetical protein